MLLALGETVADKTLTPMTAAEAQTYADRGWTRCVEVAKALKEIEGAVRAIALRCVILVDASVRLRVDARIGGKTRLCAGRTGTPKGDAYMAARVWPSPERRGTMRWLLLGFVFLLVSCGSEENPLAGTEWRLVALGHADAPSEVVGDDATARFTTATDMTGWTGCNSYGARYGVREAELRLDDLEWTEAGCPSQALFWQEQRMQDSLATVERFEVSGERLTLHGEGGQALFFERVGK